MEIIFKDWFFSRGHKMVIPDIPPGKTTIFFKDSYYPIVIKPGKVKYRIRINRSGK